MVSRTSPPHQGISPPVTAMTPLITSALAGQTRRSSSPQASNQDLSNMLRSLFLLPVIPSVDQPWLCCFATGPTDPRSAPLSRTTVHSTEEHGVDPAAA